MIVVRQITARETWPIRGEVFQPNRPLNKNKIQGDSNAMHLGAFSNEQLVAVVTWNAKGDVAKLRKLATLKAWRRQGVASMLVNYCFNQMAHQSIKSCSLLATVESLMFYKSMGFEASAPDVTRGDARYFQLRKLIDPDGVAR